MPKSSRPKPPATRSPQTLNEESQAKRDETDESLRSERRTSDGRDQRVAMEDSADRVVDVARQRADAIVTQARTKADQDAQEPRSRDDIAGDRAQADALLRDERAAADSKLLHERQDSARLLSALLPVARMRTDWRLWTERSSVDAALSNRDDFLGMVSHDLNYLLTGLVLTANTLARQVSDTPDGLEVARAASRIHLYAARMSRLVGDLTDVTSLAAGKLAVTTAPNDAKTLVAEAMATFRAVAAEKRISLAVEVPDVPLPVVCDHGRTMQVLTNLVGNAVKFTPAGGNVSASAARIGDEVSFAVMDSGRGIPEDLLQAIFERFWQAAGEEQRRGLGLGLYIAKSIVEAQGGRIWAESRMGEGSTFHFTLPADGLSSEAGFHPGRTN